MALVVKTRLPIQETKETWGRSLDQKDPLEEKMATHSSSLAWEIQQTEEPEGLQSLVSERVRHDRSDLAQ